MKKSKFLKKSLAMLLALMLVVAMIPLSAAASEPALQQVRAEADGETVLLTQNGDTFTGTYRAGAQTITLQPVVGTENRVYYTDTTTTTPTDKYVGKGPVVNFQVNRDQYADAEGNVTIEFSVADASDAKVRDYYTVELTPVEASTDTEILEFALDRTVNAGTPNENTVPNIGEVNIGVDFINVTVPYDAANAKYTIRNMVLSNGAKATVKDENGVAVANGIDVAGVQNGAPSVTVDDEYTITVSNGNHNQTYTLHITVASGFTSFTTEEGLDAVLFPEDNAIAVLLPYGYTTGKDTVTITPSYELDYLSAEAEWANGEAVTVSTANVNKTVFTSFKGTHTATNDWDWDGAKALNDLDFDKFTKNASLKEVDTVKVQYTDDTTREYKVYLFETVQNNATAITGLTIGSEQAVIDEENKTIDIVLPAGTNLASLDLGGDTTRFAMTASNNATITIPTQSNVKFNDKTADRSVDANYTCDYKIKASEPISVLVKSEDNKCSGNEQYYTLNITASDNYEDAKITGMSIQSPDGKYTYDATPDANGKIVLQVPYYVYSKAKLEGWKLFYTKTVGTSVTYLDNNDHAIALPVSGAALTGGESWIGYPGTNEPGDDITANMIGEDQSQNTRVYNVQIDRVAAKTDSTLKNFSIIGDEWKNEADNTYTAQIDQKNHVINAGIDWSAYRLADVSIAEFYAIAEAAEDANAKIYFVNKDSCLIPLGNYDEDYETGVVKNNANSKNGWDLYDEDTIYVLSEQMWVNLEASKVAQTMNGVEYYPAGTWETQLNQDNRTFYTVYTLDISENKAREGAEFTDITLVDGTGWSADLEVDISNSLLKGTIPYALTSDFTVDKQSGKITGNSLNPIFLAYDVEDGAWVMAYEEKWISQQANKKQARRDGVDGADKNLRANYKTLVPEAGEGYTDIGVFEDIKDYKASEYSDYLKGKNPFLLISREGDVYICNTDPSGSINVFNSASYGSYAVNRLVATNEDGLKEFDLYTFDLTVAQPNTETEFTNFYFDGYERFPGVIDAVNDTITVTLPYGTEYTYLVPNYTVSSGAIVTVDDPELMGKPLYNGETDVNFTTTRKFTVIAENEKNSTEWTVRVVVSSAFTDVNPGDWFYDNVMDAAQNGYVSGMGDGTFQPKKATTRAEFASMIAKAMGYTDSDATGETRFTDVDADQWYAGAITYCYDNGIILGYEDNTFKPTQTITRQEAASILKNAFNLNGSSSDKFPDDAKIANWAKANVYAVKHSGLMKGDADGNFRPTDTMTRAEAASIMMNAQRAGLID
mgnify:CR=1 FL=1